MTTPDTSALTINIVAAVGSFMFMALLFQLSWTISGRNIWRFNAFGEVTKADWCSRINSTVHSTVVCVLVVLCLVTMEFDPVTLVPLGSTTLLEVTFSISIGYWLSDLGIMLWYLLPMWTIFAIHHLVALTPYVITQFLYICHSGQYVLLLFLMVELSTLPLNAMAFLEDLGFRRTKAHLSAHILMFVTWSLCRVLLPAYLLAVIWTKVVPQYSLEETCLLPSMICAHIIALFCIGVFCFVLTPELYTRLRHGEKGDPAGMGHISGSRGGAVGEEGAMEMGVGGGPGSAGGAYHDLESADATPSGPRYPHRRNDSTVSLESEDEAHGKAVKSKGAQIVHAFKEGLLPQGDDNGGQGHTGGDRSNAGQMR